MEDYTTFIQEIELFTEDGERLSDRIQIPASYQSTSQQELEELAKQLYQTYVRQLEELEKSIEARNVLLKDVGAIRAEIDELAGRAMPPEQLLDNKHAVGQERIFEESEPRWE